MLFHPERARRLDRVADMLCADELSVDLISSTADVCERVASSRESQHIKELIDAGAWTDAALTLLGIELPAWKLRRIVYDEGEWHCAISHERELPEWLDDAIETHHRDFAMAILKAIVEALGTTDLEQRDTRRSARQPLESESLMCCDNFD